MTEYERGMRDGLAMCRLKLAETDRLLDWCAPRLSRDEYRAALLRMRDTAPTPDHTPVVLSN